MVSVNKCENNDITVTWQYLLISFECGIRGIKRLLPGNSNTQVVTLAIVNSHCVHWRDMKEVRIVIKTTHVQCFINDSSPHMYRSGNVYW